MNLRRKRMMLMDGQWYGYLRTASGNPLTLQNAKRLRKLTIYGNAVQDGTPSPDAPVDIQLCGDRTGNLYDVNDKYGSWGIAKSDDDGWITVNYDNTEGTDNARQIFFTNFRDVIEPNTEYTIVTEIEYISGCILYSSSTGRPKSPFNISIGYNMQGTHYMTVTSESDLSDCVTLLRGICLVEKGNIASTKFRISLLKGSYTADTLPAYEPYGYKVSGRAEGLNLFTSDESKWQIRTYKYFKIPVDGTTTLQMKLKPGKSIPSTLYVGYTKTGYPSDTGINWLIENGAYINSGVNMMSNSKGYISMYPPSLFDEMLDAFDIMLVQGSYTAETMPPYEPYQPPQEFAVYLPEQIAKVGDVADEVVVDMERKTAELKKNVGSMTMSDSYSGGISITDELVRFYHGTTPLRRISPSTNIIDVMSDIYEADTWNNLGTGSTDKQFVIAGNPNTQVVNVRVPKSVIGGETNELMNAWAANNPATVYYVLATPVTTDITSLQQWDAMPQVSGTVTLTLSAEVEPSGAEAVYYSKERGE